MIKRIKIRRATNEYAPVPTSTTETSTTEQQYNANPCNRIQATMGRRTHTTPDGEGETQNIEGIIVLSSAKEATGETFLHSSMIRSR